jgi:hypothetical protein
MSLRTIFFAIFLFIYSGLSAQQIVLTTAELSGYKSTSTYADVNSFIDKLKESSKDLRIENIGKTVEGRDIPLIILARPMIDSPALLKNDHRIVVYIQANIHPGEVEGKEAVLMVARDILNGKNSDILDDVIILLCPNLNADGNEKISIDNRKNQNGPVNGVGVRHNSQFLDLNRDAMKLETPEMNAVLANVINKWDPYIILDSHTTNGVYRQEAVTFSWMVNPNGDRNLINYMRDRMMPEVGRLLLHGHGVENCFYGEFYDMMKPDSGYINYAGEPRYFVNYLGLRNRLAILNENYVYADFKSRVEGTCGLIYSVLNYAKVNRNEIKELIKRSDNRLTHSDFGVNSFAIRYKVQATPEKIHVKTYEVERISGEEGMWQRYRNTGVKKTVTVPYHADYYATETIDIPYAYLLTVPDKEVLLNLSSHGIVVARGEK